MLQTILLNPIHQSKLAEHFHCTETWNGTEPPTINLGDHGGSVTIASPMYPSVYLFESNCHWRFEASNASNIIVLDILEWNASGRLSCYNKSCIEIVFVFNNQGPKGYNHNLMTYQEKDGDIVPGRTLSWPNSCGLLRSPGPTVYIEWTTDWTPVGEGFVVCLELCFYVFTNSCNVREMCYSRWNWENRTLILIAVSIIHCSKFVSFDISWLYDLSYHLSVCYDLSAANQNFSSALRKL